MSDTQEAPPAPTYYVVLSDLGRPIAVRESPEAAAQYMAARAVRLVSEPIADCTRAMSIVAVVPDSVVGEPPLFRSGETYRMSSGTWRIDEPVTAPSQSYDERAKYRAAGGLTPLGRRVHRNGDVVTLERAGDAHNFARGMPVAASPHADGSRMRTGQTTVQGFDPQSGTVTLDDPAQVVAFTDNDYLFALIDACGLGTQSASFDSATPRPDGLAAALYDEAVWLRERVRALASALTAACAELEEHANEYQYSTPASSLAWWRALAGGAP